MPRGTTPMLALRLDHGRRTRLDTLAADRGVTRTDAIRLAIDHYLAAGAPGLGHRPQLPLGLDEDAAA
jgi:hypothetical protein